MNPLRIIRPHEIKLEAARDGSLKTIGLIIRTDKTLHIFVKARKTSSLDFRINQNTSVHFFAVANSVTDGRDIEFLVQDFVANLKNIFSLRELNMELLTDFLCKTFKDNVFGKDDERPLSVEMAIVELDRSAAKVGITAIDYMGNSIEPEDDFEILIFGCPDLEKREKIQKALVVGLKPDSDDTEIEKMVSDVLAEFPGNILVWQLSPEESKPVDT